MDAEQLKVGAKHSSCNNLCPACLVPKYLSWEPFYQMGGCNRGCWLAFNLFAPNGYGSLPTDGSIPS